MFRKNSLTPRSCNASEKYWEGSDRGLFCENVWVSNILRRRREFQLMHVRRFIARAKLFDWLRVQDRQLSHPSYTKENLSSFLLFRQLCKNIHPITRKTVVLHCQYQLENKKVQKLYNLSGRKYDSITAKGSNCRLLDQNKKNQVNCI